MNEGNPNARIGAEIYQKFQFYILGLTFGVLALSVQTASFNGPVPARIAELSGWVLLLTSGIVGLWRLEWLPKQYQLSGLRGDAESRAHGLQKAAETGTRVVHVTLEQRDYPIADLIKTAQTDITAIDEHLAKVDNVAMIKYRVQKWTFLAGLLSLMIARGLGPLLDLFKSAV